MKKIFEVYLIWNMKHNNIAYLVAKSSPLITNDNKFIIL